jgi:hypothetical protein
MPGGRLWLVTVTVGGADVPADDVRAALERLGAEQPFLLSGRYATDCAELRYWEEAETCVDACALALRLWGEHRRSARLPAWEVRGVEVLEQSVAERRGDADRLLPAPVSGLVPVSPTGSWRPLG